MTSEMERQHNGQRTRDEAWLTRLPLPVHTQLCQYLNVPSLSVLR